LQPNSERQGLEWLKSWKNRNIELSIRLLERNRQRFPESDYGRRYLDVVCTLACGVDHPRVLHLGCGRDRSKVVRTITAAAAVRVVGVDRDVTSLSEYPGRQRVVADASALPLQEASCDLALSEEMFEHLERPDAMAAEVARVLRPGGRFVFATPNKLGYIGFVGWITPFWFHRLLQNVLNPGRDEGATLFPTFYRFNTGWAIDRIMRRHGLKKVRLDFTEAWPWMLRLHPLLVRIGFVWGWIVQRYEVLAPLRNRILGVYVRADN